MNYLKSGILLFSLLLLACSTKEKDEANINFPSNTILVADILRGDSVIFSALKAKDSPCNDCNQQALANYVNCCANAGNDNEKKSQCLKQLVIDQGGCPCPGSPVSKKSEGKEVSPEEAIRGCKADVEWMKSQKNKLSSITITVWGLQLLGGAYTWYQADPCSYNAGMCQENQKISIIGPGGTCILPGGREVSLYTFTYKPL